MAEPDAPGAGILDPLEEYPPTWAYMDAEDVVREVLERDAGGVFRLRRRPSVAPVLTVSDRFLVGTLDLRAVELPYLLEFIRCRFQHAPDLRQAKLAGIEFNQCWLPGLDARNLSSENDLKLVDGTVVDGPVDLTDGDIRGSLVLAGCRINVPDGIALHACRLTLAGAVSAPRLQVSGEVRIPGLRAGGNVNLAGARLSNRKGFSLNGNGLQIGGNMHMTSDPATGRFASVGRLFLPSARIEGDFSLRGAILEPPPEEVTQVPVDERFFDPEATLIADRVHVAGNVDVDQGFESTGTLRIVNASIGGTLRLTRATVDLSGGAESFEERADGSVQGPYPHRALHLDGTEIRGGIDARNARIAGQVRVVDLVAQGSVVLDGAVVSNPHGDAVEGRRFTTGGNLDGRGITVFGSILLPGAKIGSNVDLGGSRLSNPGHYRDGNPKPAVDLRVAQIGRDLICADRSGQPFSTQGEIRMRRAEIGRETNFRGAELGSELTVTALNAFGLITQELRLDVGVAPRGRVSLRHARCASFADNEKFWNAEERIDLDDFRYDALIRPIALDDDAQIKLRLKWLRHAMRDVYRPGPYDQFAAMLRASGNEEHAATVLIAKQRRRYVALSEGYRVLGPLVRVWSWLQLWMVGYGYRPMRALFWLIACLAFGTTWFAVQPVPQPVSVDDANLVWNAPLYTLDLVIPIVDFGQKNRWEFVGVSQWISTALVAAGWILATTVAAGLTRMLRRST
ncbi:MAG TPA: hypothetical protein VGX25_28415 [Actinophytocola sp.]|uniref:hypothetical protein n=1 Tax=Actinophytocola sp. TaxID=1872138 RepID=UPI002DDCB65D|nr:hypothetical protein [Actinophytocola sp.]HEV2783326.1 hypothetical protein [Actinophytocola sp.]